MKVLLLLAFIICAFCVKAQTQKIEIRKKIGDTSKPTSFYIVSGKDTLLDKKGVIILEEGFITSHVNSLFTIHFMESGLQKGWVISPILLGPQKLSVLYSKSPFILKENSTN